MYIELESASGSRGVWLDRIRPDFTETIAVLKELGVEEDQLFQIDPAIAEKYGW